MELNSNQIAQILPQAYPFLMIDRVVDFRKGESLTAIKNITGNEWVFEGQSCPTGAFPETLLIEAAAQAAILFIRPCNLSADKPRRVWRNYRRESRHILSREISQREISGTLPLKSLCDL